MIRSWRHRGIQELFKKGRSSRVRADLQDRALRRLDALNEATALKQLNVPGFGFHALRGKPARYALAVNGPWRITFEWRDGDAYRVSLEQYH
ncbi:MAG: type II toxin-antitoxin system RelE/ParE family toxin [Gammaproteobacteria bacterium]|nr:type II toxin-antitoxin system RelE/ParE family toxin [Gammaproteobacteria bacterium]